MPKEIKKHKIWQSYGMEKCKMQVETCYEINYLQNQYEDPRQIFLRIRSRSKGFKWRHVNHLAGFLSLSLSCVVAFYKNAIYVTLFMTWKPSQYGLQRSDEISWKNVENGN